MRVYLDNCCYNRPFDEQAQLSVRLETEAKLEIQRQMRSGELEYSYTKWRENMYKNESLHSLAERSRAAGERFRKTMAIEPRVMA
jgi:hypothetical protein